MAPLKKNKLKFKKNQILNLNPILSPLQPRTGSLWNSTHLHLDETFHFFFFLVWIFSWVLCLFYSFTHLHLDNTFILFLVCFVFFTHLLISTLMKHFISCLFICLFYKIKFNHLNLFAHLIKKTFLCPLFVLLIALPIYSCSHLHLDQTFYFFCPLFVLLIWIIWTFRLTQNLESFSNNRFGLI